MKDSASVLRLRRKNLTLKYPSDSGSGGTLGLGPRERDAWKPLGRSSSPHVSPVVSSQPRLPLDDRHVPAPASQVRSHGTDCSPPTSGCGACIQITAKCVTLIVMPHVTN